MIEMETWYLAFVVVIASVIIYVIYKIELQPRQRKGVIFGPTEVIPYQGSELILPRDNRTYHVWWKQLFSDGSYNLGLGDEKGVTTVLEVKNPAAISPESGIMGMHNLIAPTHGKLVFRFLDSANADPKILHTRDFERAVALIQETLNYGEGAFIRTDGKDGFILHIGDSWKYMLNWQAMQEKIDFLSHERMLLKQLVDTYKYHFSEIAQEEAQSATDLILSVFPTSGRSRGMSSENPAEVRK